jgi:5-methylcytosine-specific restriction endonuclease McrA
MSKLRGLERTEFPLSVRKLAFARCCKPDGIPKCENCGNPLRSGNVEYEHIVPAGLGGGPTLENCGVWCRVPCSKQKTFGEDLPRMQKADRVLKASFGLKPKKRPMPGSKASGIRRRMDGTVERRS